MRQQKERPGFLVFHDMLPTFRKMSHESVGRFVIAMGEYSERGIVPDFGDDVRADTLWDQTQPRMDTAATGYQSRIDSASYAGWCSSLKDAGLEYRKIPFEDWKTATEEYRRYKDQRKGQHIELFTDWLIRERERAEKEDEGKLPWNEDDEPP